jgi:prepilin-type N-terminal cleavage/methylation domain-containing protein
MDTPKPFTRGFTLVEILVVILVLVVIAAILYPVLTVGRGQEQRIGVH